MKKAMIISCGLLFLVGVGILVTYLIIRNYENTPSDGSEDTIAVEIPKGAGPQKISELLQQHKVITDAQAFYRYVRYYKRASGDLKSGELAFKGNLTPAEVLKVLLDGTPITHKITIPEGLRIDEVANLFAQEGLADAKAFESKARDPNFVRSLGVPGESLEGFLFPETYHFRKQTPLEDILKTMVAGYQKTFDDSWRKRAQEIHLNELQVITLASIIEKETAVTDERFLISGVFHNRLKENWRMDTDPSVIYAVLLTRGTFSGNLTKEDLRIDHPYNTYRHKGLPPGPICSPGKDAIEAALYPEKTEYMFFVSKNDGTHYFCPNLACHNRAVARYQGGN